MAHQVKKVHKFIAKRWLKELQLKVKIGVEEKLVVLVSVLCKFFEHFWISNEACSCFTY